MAILKICFLERRQKPIFCNFWYYQQPFQKTFSSGSEDIKIFSFNINYFLFDFLKVMLFNNCIRLILGGGHIEKIPPEKTTFKRPYLLELKLLLNLQKKILGCWHQTRKFIKIAATQLLCCEFYKIFKNNFLTKHLWITSFENWSYFPASFPGGCF